MSTEASAPSLVVRTGEGERSLAAGRAYLVGRDPQADIVVADARVSWHHAELRRRRGRWVLADLGSTNGSYADGGRADLIEIDGTRQVRLGDPEDGPAARLHAAAPRRYAGLAQDAAHRPDTGQRHRGPPPQRLPPPRRAAHDAGGYRIVDLGSHNGTFVNEQRVTAAALAEGDTVGFGDTTFRLAGGELLQIAEPGAGADAARARPHGRNRDRGPVGRLRGRSGTGLPRGPAPTRPGQALRWPRSRTRCAGWCRGASGSRTSTS